MKLDFKGKTAVITGASGGMGLEISKKLSQNNISVLMLDLKKPSNDFLKKNNLPHPKAQQLDQPITMDYPLIAKSNKGSGSKNIVWIEDELDLTFVKRKHPGHILQEFLPADEGEYTCGLFRSSDESVFHRYFPLCPSRLHDRLAIQHEADPRSSASSCCLVVPSPGNRYGPGN